MSALALRLSRYRNGVSRLHGQVARSMWADLWPDGADAPAPGEGAPTNGVRSARIVSFPGTPPPDRVPIGHVTNGVHLPTWVSPPMRDLFDRYLGPDWEILQDDPALWERALDLPDHRLWEAHLANKGRLFSVLRQRARDGWREAGTTAEQVVAAGTLLDPEYLTIGFARRFATYKRASLVFRDLERLERILLHSERPVQLVFAGKAHPADAPGQEILAEIYRMAMNPRLAGRVAFASDYEIVLARDMYSGVDLWLNNPRPPMEACGTSGQKAAINGVPQLSTLDGWWAEGWTGLNGWAIRPDAPIEQEVDPAARDGADAEAIYDLLEGEISPLFYDRDVDGVPRSWIRVMKQAIRTAGARFSARRMLKEYVEMYYVPAARGGREDEAGTDRTGG
jgi:starch phosphorylase